ncbi:MAG: hypothetical protein VX589_13125 [Myxococcota bacterium]|nr:hypothetical protein [Myxococcota bacterium]
MRTLTYSGLPAHSIGILAVRSWHHHPRFQVAAALHPVPFEPGPISRNEPMAGGVRFQRQGVHGSPGHDLFITALSHLAIINRPVAAELSTSSRGPDALGTSQPAGDQTRNLVQDHRR